MKILVTGGAGFIGSILVDRLIGRGYEVVVVDNLSVNDGRFVNRYAKFYASDITDFKVLDRIFRLERPEIVFHLAAQTMLRESITDPFSDANTNIIGTIGVLEACKNNNVRRIIYTSTGGARVGNPDYLPVDEKHPLKPTSPYGISKHSAEHYVETYASLHNINLEHLIFCFGNAYGPRDSPETKRLVPLFMDMIRKNVTPKIFGDGNQTRDFIYVEDLVELMVDSINKTPENKLFHLASGAQTSVNEIYNVLKDVTGFVNDAERVDAVAGEVRDIVLDISLAQRQLGWDPKTGLKSGVKKTWDWVNNPY